MAKPSRPAARATRALKTRVCSITLRVRSRRPAPKLCEIRDTEEMPITSFRNSTSHRSCRKMVTPPSASEDPGSRPIQNRSTRS